jgi:hypothetical protein
MTDIQIVYTPDAEQFILDPFTNFHRHPTNPKVLQLRENYKMLKQAFPELPAEVGVVAYCDLFKKFTREQHEIRSQDRDFYPVVTFYPPLDVLDSMMKLKHEDISDTIAEQYVYRALTLLVMDPALPFDEGLPSYVKPLLYMLPNMPSYHKTADIVAATYNEFNAKGGELTADQKEGVRLRREVCGSWDTIEELRAFVKERFEANKVRRDFPLIYVPTIFHPSIYHVVLDDRVETPQCSLDLLEIVRRGCEVQGLTEIPENVKTQLLATQKDHYGTTLQLSSMEDLLDKLLAPKTIITDAYIADRFPDLKGKINTREFMLNH